MTAQQGSFIWYDLMTTDVPAAEAFYRAVVGWEAADQASSPTPYKVLSAAGRGVGGLMPLPAEARAAGAQPGWIGYIAVDDVDAASSRLAEAGGTIHRAPADIPGIGRFAVVADPQGAVFMLITPTGWEPPPAPPMTPGHICWHELYAVEGRSAFAFYAGQFGWAEADALDMGAMGTYQIFAMGGMQSGGMMTKPASFPAPFWLFYAGVAQIDAAAERIAREGGQVLSGPMEVPGGAWIVQARDPQGAMFAVVGPR